MISRRVSFTSLGLALSLTVVGLGSYAVADPGLPSADPVRATVETANWTGGPYTYDGGDVSDDSAIYANPTDPANSVVIADNKSNGSGASAGGIGVFSMSGSLLQYRQGDGQIGNVDLRTTDIFASGSKVLVGGNRRDNSTIRFWILDPATRTLSAPVEASTISTDSLNYGFCMGHTTSGNLNAYVLHENGVMKQYRLTESTTTAGKVAASLVRTFDVGGQSEGCVVDDDNGYLFIGEENVGVWRYSSSSTGGSTRTSIASVGSNGLTADVEGLSIAETTAGAGYLYVSSQGNSKVHIYNRNTGSFVRSFSVSASADGSVDAVTTTDGVDVTTANLGPNFPDGALVVHDNSNSGGSTSNLKYVPLTGAAAPPPPPTNTAPAVNAGADSSVTLPASASLDGTVSDDGLPAGSTVTSTWSKVSGPGTVTFGSASAVDTTASFSAAGSYVLRLTATDGALSGQDDVTVTVSAAPSSGTVSIVASDDSYVDDVAKTSNFGSDTSLSVDVYPSVQDTYLKFDLSSLAGKTVTAASLRMRTATGSSAGSDTSQTIYYTTNATWSESTLTYNNRTGWLGATGAIAVGGSVPNTSYTGTLTTSHVQSAVGSALTLILAQNSSNGVDYQSSEVSTVANRPTLIVTYEDSSTPPASTSAAELNNWGTPILSDEFNYTGAPDPAKWSVYDSAGHAGNGVRSPAQVTVNGSALRITGLSNGTTGGMSTDSALRGQTYGRYETRMRVSNRDSEYHPVLIIWPNAGRVSANNCMELDYAESTSDPSLVKFFNHYNCSGGQTTASKAVDMTQWHNYAIEWTSTHVIGYVDGEVFFTDTVNVPDDPAHQTIQLDWFPDGTATTESWLEVDWWRSYTP